MPAPSKWAGILVLAALATSSSPRGVHADGSEWVIDAGRASSVHHADPRMLEGVEERRSVPAGNRRGVAAAGSRHAVGRADPRRSSTAADRVEGFASERTFAGASELSSSSGAPREVLNPYGSVRASNLNR